MDESRPHTHLPDFERLSLLMALILLNFTMAQFLRLPEGELEIRLLGLYLKLQLGAQELVALLVALISAAGADWVLQLHPHYQRNARLDHLLLPAITSWAIGMPIFQIPISPIWWVAFILGSVLLTLVLLSEYFVTDPSDLRYPLAAAVLTSVSYALYLLIAAALQHSGLRLILILPALAVSVFFISLRILRLRPNSKWPIPEAAITTFLIVQIASPLHYLPISPISYGLAILGPAYAATIFFAGLSDDKSIQEAIPEPLTILGLVWLSAFLLR